MDPIDIASPKKKNPCGKVSVNIKKKYIFF